jgi:zinc transport system substrate-binding protein
MALLVGACAPSDAADDGLVVVASFYALAEAAERVGGSVAEVVNLTPPGVEPHDLELAPDDLELLLEADVVLYVGGGFQPAVEDGIDDVSGRAVDVLEGLETLPPTEADELTADPHVWLDPLRYADIVERVVGVLADVAPDDAAAFRSHADEVVADLEALDAEFRDRLSDCERRTVVVNHAAFGYLADAYGLEQHPISGIAPEAEVDPARLAELRELVLSEGVTTIFTEELASPEVAQTLASEAEVATAVLNPLEGLTAEELEAGEDYVSVMRRNLRTLEVGLGCA